MPRGRAVAFVDRAAAQVGDVAVHDVHPTVPGDGARHDPVREQRAGVRGGEVVRHLEIDRVLRRQRGNPSRYMRPVAGGVHHPMVAVARHPVRRAVGREADAVERQRQAGPERPEARIDT